MKQRVLLLAPILLLLSQPAVSGLKEAEEAFQRDDYPEAFREYLALAESGVAQAQDMIGIMYMLGVGTPKNYALGILWLTLAAANGMDGSAETRDTLVQEWGDDILKDLSTLSERRIDRYICGGFDC